MKFLYASLLVSILLILSSICSPQGNPKLENASEAVRRAFETHDIVMLGEIHRNQQKYEWLRSLVATPEFADSIETS